MDIISRYIRKHKSQITIFVLLFCFIFASLITINSASKLIDSDSLMFRQLMWYLVGFIFIFIIVKLKNKFLYDNVIALYIIGVVSLALLLVFATPINNSKCWFNVFNLFTIQPSEFMKIILILTLAVVLKDFNTNHKNPSVLDEFKFLLKVFIIILIPALLTFLQPDTGVVLIYLIITIIMLFISGIRYRWFIILFSILFLLIGSVLLIYFINTDLFIKIFGTSFFLRVDRLLDWSNLNGYQLENGLISIGSGGFIGMGIGNTPIYFPEAQTDFIFAVFANNFGFIGSAFLIVLILLFDLKLIDIAKECNSNINKYVLAGTIGMLMYQQFQNIGMTVGLMPITGITLPFISYGGSSLISYMIIIGIVINIINEEKKIH